MAEDLTDVRILEVRKATGGVVLEQAQQVTSNSRYVTGDVDPFCIVYLNGRRVGETQRLGFSAPDEFWHELIPFPASYLRTTQPNKLAIEVLDFESYATDQVLGLVEMSFETLDEVPISSIEVPLAGPVGKACSFDQLSGRIKFRVVMPLRKVKSARHGFAAARLVTGTGRAFGSFDQQVPSSDMSWVLGEHNFKLFPLWRHLPNGGKCAGCGKKKITQYCSVCFLCEECAKDQGSCGSDREEGKQSAVASAKAKYADEWEMLSREEQQQKVRELQSNGEKDATDGDST